MNVRHKLMAGYLLAALLITLSGVFGVYGTEKIVTLLQGKDERLRSIVISASKLTLDAKDAETDITLYLLLGDKTLREEYFRHLADLKNVVRSLDEVVQVPQGKKLLVLIRDDIERVIPAGQALLDSFDTDMKAKGSYVPSDHTALTDTFLELTSNIRRYGLKLAALETDFLNKQQAITASMELASYAKRLEGHLIAYLLLQNKEDRQKVFDRYQSLKQMTSILDEKMDDPAPRKILDDVRTDTDQIMPAVQELLKANGSDIQTNGRPTRENYEALLRKISTLTDRVGDNGLALARFNVALEIEPKKLALESARFLQFMILVVTVIPVILAFILGYAANRKANELEESRSNLADLNNELADSNARLRTEILEHKKAEEEKSNLISELQNALVQVKKLSGLIPICASCKKIRDDKGYWRQVEEYVRDHSEAQFSHSICPDCMRKLYPEIAEEVLSRLEKDEKK
jgi:CHASE3 domain sensor protein